MQLLFCNKGHARPTRPMWLVWMHGMIVTFDWLWLLLQLLLLSTLHYYNPYCLHEAPRACSDTESLTLVYLFLFQDKPRCYCFVLLLLLPLLLLLLLITSHNNNTSITITPLHISLLHAPTKHQYQPALQGSQKPVSTSLTGLQMRLCGGIGQFRLSSFWCKSL